MVSAALKASPIQAKDLGNRRQPGTIVQTGAKSVKIIIAFCSLSGGETVNKAEYQEGFRVGRKSVADLSCSALCPSQEIAFDIHLSHQEAGSSKSPWKLLETRQN